MLSVEFSSNIMVLCDLFQASWSMSSIQSYSESLEPLDVSPTVCGPEHLGFLLKDLTVSILTTLKNCNEVHDFINEFMSFI